MSASNPSDLAYAEPWSMAISRLLSLEEESKEAKWLKLLPPESEEGT
jgi:hypothetical protein